MAMCEITHSLTTDNIGWLHERKEGRVNRLRRTRKVHSKGLKREIKKEVFDAMTEASNAC